MRPIQVLPGNLKIDPRIRGNKEAIEALRLQNDPSRKSKKASWKSKEARFFKGEVSSDPNPCKVNQVIHALLGHVRRQLNDMRNPKLAKYPVDGKTASFVIEFLNAGKYPTFTTIPDPSSLIGGAQVLLKQLAEDQEMFGGLWEWLMGYAVSAPARAHFGTWTTSFNAEMRSARAAMRARNAGEETWDYNPKQEELSLGREFDKLMVEGGGGPKEKQASPAMKALEVASPALTKGSLAGAKAREGVSRKGASIRQNSPALRITGAAKEQAVEVVADDKKEDGDSSPLTFRYPDYEPPSVSEGEGDEHHRKAYSTSSAAGNGPPLAAAIFALVVNAPPTSPVHSDNIRRTALTPFGPVLNAAHETQASAALPSIPAQWSEKPSSAPVRPTPAVSKRATTGRIFCGIGNPLLNMQSGDDDEETIEENFELGLIDSDSYADAKARIREKRMKKAAARTN